MPNLLQKGLSWLDDQRHKHMSLGVVYARGADSVSLSATVGRTVFEQADELGVIHRSESRDYLIRAEDLVLAGVLTTPRAGDRITETDGALIHTYEVNAPGGEPPWRFSDPHRIALRIHTKRIKTEATP